MLDLNICYNTYMNQKLTGRPEHERYHEEELFVTRIHPLHELSSSASFLHLGVS